MLDLAQSARRWAGTPAVMVALTIASTSALACGGQEQPASASVEAETLRLQGQRGSIQTDSSASGGKSLSMFGEDTAERSVNLPAARFLTVRASAEQCDGAPRLIVTVDDSTVLDEPVTSPSPKDYRAKVNLDSGEHRLAIRYADDLAAGDCDRNLVVDVLDFSTSAEPLRPGPQAEHQSYDARIDSRPSKLLFEANFANGLDEYAFKVNRDLISVVDDPVLGKKRQVLKFSVSQGDTGPTDNPRAQLETPFNFREGDDRYFGYSVLFPSDFPARLPDQAWITLGEQAYGPPFQGAAGTSLRVQNVIGGEGTELRWQRNDTYDNDIPWRGPKIDDVRGRWVDIIQRIRLDSDAEKGFVELWLNTGDGWMQQKLDGKERLYMSTYDDANDEGANNSRLSLYYRKDIPGPLTLYHGAHKIATAGRGAFEAVDPQSYGRAGG